MAVVECAVVAAAASAGALLAGDGRSVAEWRLAALAPRPASAPRRRACRTGWKVRALAACAPLAVLVPLLGMRIGVPVGALVGGVVWWRLGQGGASAARGRAAAITAALPLAVDLFVAGLRSGAHPTDVTEAVADAVRGPLGAALAEVARRSRLGADPVRVWGGLREPAELAAFGAAVARASRTGAPLADVLEVHAEDCRRAARARALAAAQRTGVAVVLPLGLCFLPAFVLVGVVPLAAALLSDLVLP